MADWPGVCVVMRYAPQNHVESGMWLDCITVPAVRDVFFLQARQRNTTDERVAKRQGSPMSPHFGQEKPSGQRIASKYLAHAPSSGKTLWNLGRLVGKVVSMI